MKKYATSLRRFVMTISVGLSAAVALAGPLGTLDDFSTPGLSEYTLTRVLDNGISESNISFSDATGALVASYGGTINQAEQVFFLRNDASLGVGEMLFTDIAQPVSTTTMEIGLGVTSTATPTEVAGAVTDTRTSFEWASIAVRPSGNAVRINSGINGVITTTAGSISAEETTVSQLYIRRNTATNFTFGFVDTNMLSFNNISLNFTSEMVGAGVGIYADLRATGTTLGPLDNLRIIPSADVNGDLAVDLDDFDIIKMNLFNTSQSRAQGDLNGDRTVDFTDFRLWKNAAGSGFASVSLFGVPEPTSFGLLAGCVLSMLAAMRRRARSC